MARIGDENTGIFWQVLYRYHADMHDWCRGRLWLVRLPLWLFLTYVAVNQLRNDEYRSIFGGISLGIHEGGHLLMRGLGHFLHIFGGTLLEVMAPVGAMIMFLKQRDYFGISVGLGWLSTVLYSVGYYMADAEKMELPLVTVGDAQGIVKHDWRELFSMFGVLEQCETIGWLTCRVGDFSMLICLIVGGWLMWRMFRSRNELSPR
ncbi:MAG: hypothetical protein V1899_08905 [Planctomycetota bacterium]